MHTLLSACMPPGLAPTWGSARSPGTQNSVISTTLKACAGCHTTEEQVCKRIRSRSLRRKDDNWYLPTCSKPIPTDRDVPGPSVKVLVLATAPFPKCP